uniref:SWIM-type domain-containing protein n=1 Tax=Tanacetum cinerariifolium TaxID=118510 RepID=A0A699HT36_TANCI|nr:hypothetical protein [Tanacetum cinerariifolium]
MDFRNKKGSFHKTFNPCHANLQSLPQYSIELGFVTPIGLKSMDCSSSILSSIQLPINNGNNQAVTSDATVVEPDAQTIDVDQQQMVKTLGIVRLTDDGVKSYKPDVSDSVKPLKGKLLNTLEDALHFYKTYAKLSGFEARKSTQYKRKDDKNKYVVCSFDEEHNHPFVDEDDISLLKSSRKLTFSKKKLLFRVSNNNIGPMKAFKMMKELFGGFDEVGVTSVDYEVAKHNYLSFGDVISFDATFCSNKYKMVFVPFPGIDNHHRSVTLATALLSNETAESYGWLLRAFKKAFGCEPMVVVTEQDPTMKIAVEKEFCNSRHRLYNFALSSLGIKPLRIYELRIGRTSALSKQGVQTTDQPMSGLMRTTSWSESEKYFFGQLTSTTLTLVEFVSHFDTAMDIQRYTHRTNQQITQFTTPDLLTDYVLEKEAREIYTRTIFYDIQEEICASITDCMSMSMMTIDGTHILLHKGDKTRSRFSRVLFTPSDVTLSCSCKRFERYGLLCRHSFYVLRICGDSEFPKRYVSRRWTRDAVTREKRTVFDGRNKFSDGSTRDEIIKDIIGSVEYCIKKLASNIEELAKFQDRLQDIKSKVDTDMPNKCSMFDLEVISSALGVSKPSKVKICNPLKSKNKGDRSNSRIIPSKERAMTDGAKKGRKCNHCGDLDADHDS